MNGKEAAKQLQGAIGVKNESEMLWDAIHTVHTVCCSKAVYTVQVVSMYVRTYVRTYTRTYTYVTKKVHFCDLHSPLARAHQKAFQQNYHSGWKQPKQYWSQHFPSKVEEWESGWRYQLRGINDVRKHSAWVSVHYYSNCVLSSDCNQWNPPSHCSDTTRTQQSTD